MRLPVLILFLCLAASIPAQTRKIAHRSHGGQPASFTMLMDDDHAGMPVIKQPYLSLENYHLEPWVVRIREHYEKIAAQQPAASAPATKGVTEPAGSDPKPTEPSSDKAKDAPAQPVRKAPAAPKQAAQPSGGEPESAGTVAVPPFRLAKALPENNSQGGLLLLAGLLVVIVGPGVMYLSGMFQKKSA